MNVRKAERLIGSGKLAKAPIVGRDGLRLTRVQHFASLPATCCHRLRLRKDVTGQSGAAANVASAVGSPADGPRCQIKRSCETCNEAAVRAPPLDAAGFGHNGSVAGKYLVGVRGFEPPAPASRRQCSTRLSYTPAAARRIAAPPDGRNPGQERRMARSRAAGLSGQFGMPGANRWHRHPTYQSRAASPAAAGATRSSRARTAGTSGRTSTRRDAVSDANPWPTVVLRARRKASAQPASLHSNTGLSCSPSCFQVAISRSRPRFRSRPPG